MTPLTKEQIDYLLSRLNNIPLAATTYSEHTTWHCSDVKAALVRCLPPPCIVVKSLRNDKSEVGRIILTGGDRNNFSQITLEEDSERITITFNDEEMKDIHSALSTILTWLEP